VITDSHLTTSLCEVENITWDEKTVDDEIQKADFALFPDNLSGRGKYKSNNKTVHAWALGLPVAKTKNDMIRFLEEEERIKESTERLEQVWREYNVKISAQQMDELVNDIWKTKNKTGENSQ
jgi:predicted metal-dependent hydrolase